MATLDCLLSRAAKVASFIILVFHLNINEEILIFLYVVSRASHKATYMPPVVRGA